MAYDTLTGLLKGIADSIRSKKGTTAAINAQNLPSEISSIVKATGSATASQVLSGVTFSNSSGGSTGTMTNNGAVSKSISPGDSYTVPAGYHNGSGTVSAAANTGTAETSHVLEGKTFYGSGATKQTGVMPNNGAWGTTLSPGGSATVPAGYHSGGTVSANMPSGNAGTGDVLSGKTFSNSSTNGATGTMPNRGAWGTSISPGGSVTIPAGYHNGSGSVVANNRSPSNMIIARNTEYVVTCRSGNFIDIDSAVNVPSTRISMIITGGVGINDSGWQIGTTTVKAIATNGTEYTCNYSNGCYFVPTDTTYTKVTVHHSNYGGAEMSHGVIGPIIVFGY